MNEIWVKFGLWNSELKDFLLYFAKRNIQVFCKDEVRITAYVKIPKNQINQILIDLNKIDGLPIVILGTRNYKPFHLWLKALF